MCRPNVWPEKHLPQLKLLFQKLGQLMAVVGEQLAALCDQYMRDKVALQKRGCTLLFFGLQDWLSCQSVHISCVSDVHAHDQLHTHMPVPIFTRLSACRHVTSHMHAQGGSPAPRCQGLCVDVAELCRECYLVPGRCNRSCRRAGHATRPACCTTLQTRNAPAKALRRSRPGVAGTLTTVRSLVRTPAFSHSHEFAGRSHISTTRR